MSDPLTLAFALARFAPQVVKWITGSDKAEAAAGAVVNIAERVTGRGGQDAVDAIKIDPALMLNFQQAVRANETELDRLYLADVGSARSRDVELAKVGRMNWRADVLAVVAVGGLVGCAWLIAAVPDLNENARYAIMMIAGNLAAAVQSVYNFEFGSSRGSKEKDKIIKGSQ